MKPDDFVFNLGLTGNTKYSQENNFYRSEVTAVYGINKRFIIYDNNNCVLGHTTKMISFDSITFYGLGTSLEDSRRNAFLESRQKASNQIVDNINYLLSAELDDF